MIMHCCRNQITLSTRTKSINTTRDVIIVTLCHLIVSGAYKWFKFFFTAIILVCLCGTEVAGFTLTRETSIIGELILQHGTLQATILGLWEKMSTRIALKRKCFTTRKCILKAFLNKSQLGWIQQILSSVQSKSGAGNQWKHGKQHTGCKPKGLELWFLVE